MADSWCGVVQAEQQRARESERERCMRLESELEKERERQHAKALAAVREDMASQLSSARDAQAFAEKVYCSRVRAHTFVA